MNVRRGRFRWTLGVVVFGYLFAAVAFCVAAYSDAMSNTWLTAFTAVNLVFAVFMIAYQLLVVRLSRQTNRTAP